MFMQSIGLLPDNVIVLTAARNKSEERIKEKLRQYGKGDIRQLAKQAIDESELNLTSVKEIYKGFMCEISTEHKKKDDILTELEVIQILINFLESNQI